MRAKPNRPINEAEITVVRVALQRAAVTTEAKVLESTVANLRVVDQCHCGCPSVDFARSSSEYTRPIADGVGITSCGGQVGVIIWGVSDAITGLEIYDLSASASDLRLPDLQSIVPWEEAAA